MRTSDALFERLHEAFRFSINSRPTGSYCPVVKTTMFCISQLPLLTTSGHPYLEKIASSLGITTLPEVSISASGNLLYSSITTIRYSPEGNGPQKSTATSFQGAFGSLVGFVGSKALFPCVVAWHARQLHTLVFTSLSIPGNHTFSRISSFVLTMPWCPMCAKTTALAWSDLGNTILFLPRMIPF